MNENEKAIRGIVYDRSSKAGKVYDHDAIPIIDIVGVGGIGSWTALAFAMAGVPELHLHDSDEVGVSNLGRTPLTMDDIGRQKTEAVRDLILRLRPSAKIVCHPAVAKTEDLKSVRKGGLVVLCVDSAEQNNLVLKAVEGKGARVLRGAYDVDRITVMDAGYQWDDGPGGYGAQPSYLVPPMIVAALLVEKAYRKPEIDINGVAVSEAFKGEVQA